MQVRAEGRVWVSLVVDEVSGGGCLQKVCKVMRGRVVDVWVWQQQRS